MDTENIRKEFPLLRKKIRGKEIVYLDSAATALKPQRVVQAIEKYYYEYGGNVHRGTHSLTAETTEQFENAREKIAKHINASSEEIIFTRNTTEGINLVAYSYGRKNIKKNNLILLTEMEHHSNLVPWQTLALEKKAQLKYIPITAEGQLDVQTAEELLKEKPKILAITHVSNVLGTINPIKEIIKQAHEQGTIVVVDGAQSFGHIPVDIKELDADFYAFSGHKALGPTGIGVLYGKKKLLEKMDPFLTGGEMIKEVGKFETQWNTLPYKFEAGTPNIAGVFGLGAVIDFIEELGITTIEKHEQEMTAYALEQLQKIPQIKVYGPKKVYQKKGIISFNLADIHAHDVISIVDEEGIIMRSGHACAMPLMEALGVAAVCRMSFHIYTSRKDIDHAMVALQKAVRVFKV